MSENEALFGHVAVDLGLISKNQLVDVTRLQNDPEESRSIGRLMVELGWVTPDQVEEILAEQQRRQGRDPAAQTTADQVAEPAPCQDDEEQDFRPQPQLAASFTSPKPR